MKKTIILYHPRTLHEKAYRFFYIPYSLLSIASNLNRHKYDVRIVDANLDTITTQELKSIFDKNDVLCVGISSMIGHQIRGGLSFAQKVRSIKDDVPIVWGGALTTILPWETVKHPLVDVVVDGQGQITFVELVEGLSKGCDLNEIAGIYFKKDGEIFQTTPREFVNWSHFSGFQEVFDMVRVLDYVRNDEHINTRTINYHTSQGCPFNCGFCSEVALWKRRWGGFSAETIISDVEYLIDAFKINGVKFYDAEFFINQKRVIEFAQLVVERGLTLRWAAAVHPRNFARLSDSQLDLLRQSGLARLLMGAESGIQEELDLIGKGTTPEMIIEMAHKCSQYGIVGCFTFVTGYPGFPLEHIKKTVAFASKLRRVDFSHECKIHLYGPYPGTPLYSRALDFGFQPPNTLEEWSHHDYYEVTTPWVPRWAQELIREFNEENYIYMSQPSQLHPRHVVA